MRGQATATWRLRLQVKPDGEAPFDARLTEAVPLGEEIAVGQSMAVLYDPHDHSRVVIDHGPCRGTERPEAGVSSEAMQETSPGPTALTTRWKSTMDGEVTSVRRGMLAHPSAGGLKLTGVSRAAGHGAPEAEVEDRRALLADLRNRGALTAAEFEQQMRRTLGD